MMKFKIYTTVLSLGILAGCSDVSVPSPRNVDIPTPVAAETRREAVNERPDSVMYLPLGEDVLVPERMTGQSLPKEYVGPFELRGETLAGALQLILADYDVSIAFESDEGLTRRVTVANLKGDLDSVVNRVCSLADLYCSYEDGTIVVKDTQTFTVSLPPLGGTGDDEQEFIDDVMAGLTAVIGGNGAAPVSDPTTRTIIYSTSQRTSKLAENYFQRLRANTAMIVFETYIWEVSLNAGNSAGVNWDKLSSFGKFNTSLSINGSVAADFTNPVSIGLPTTSAVDPTELLEFLSQFGAVKTISQPQITVLSGSSAELRVADTENYVSEVSSTVSGDNTATSVSTDSVDSGFTLNVGSSWDKSTVYANVNINLTNVDDIQDFAFDTDGVGGATTIQLPQTTERELTTQIRVRPGDSVLIAGLVRESDNFSSRGPGFMEPLLPDSRTAETDNLEMVILLRPRVIVYTASDNPQYLKSVGDKITEIRGGDFTGQQSEVDVLSPITDQLTNPLTVEDASEMSSFKTFDTTMLSASPSDVGSYSYVEIEKPEIETIVGDVEKSYETQVVKAEKAQVSTTVSKYVSQPPKLDEGNQYLGLNDQYLSLNERLLQRSDDSLNYISQRIALDYEARDKDSEAPQFMTTQVRAVLNPEKSFAAFLPADDVMDLSVEKISRELGIE